MRKSPTRQGGRLGILLDAGPRRKVRAPARGAKASGACLSAIEGSRDVSADVANELRRRCDLEDWDVPERVRDFVDRHSDGSSQLTLRLVRPG
jgi:hypothetical protein